MKKLFFLIILLPFLAVAQTDTILSENGSITSINEKGINALVIKYENSLKAKNGIEGYRVQLAIMSRGEEGRQLKTDFIKLYPEIPVYLKYESPYYRIRVGNFRTKLEAKKIQYLINKNFPGAYVVSEIINFSQPGN